MAALSGSAPPRMSPRLRLVMCMKLAEQGPYYAEDDQRRTAGSHPRRQAPPVARPGGARNERGRHRGEGRMARGMGRESRARLHARRHPRDPGRRGRRLRTRSAARRSGAYRRSAGGLSQGGDAGGPYRARQGPSPGRYLCLLRILRVRQGRRAGRERPRHVRAAAAEIGTTVKRLLGLLAAFAASAAMAQKFPSRPVTMIVPYAAGGSADVVARPVAAEMAKVLGENVVVELRPGAGGNIGAEYVAKSARADGYTILLASLSLATNVSLMKLPFDPRKDLAPIGGICTFPNVLVVSAQDPARSLRDIVERARAARQAHLWLFRSGDEQPSRGRAARRRGEPRARPRAVQGQRRRLSRSDRPARDDAVRSHGLGFRTHQRRPGQGARDDRCAACRRVARRADVQRKRFPGFSVRRMARPVRAG